MSLIAPRALQQLPREGRWWVALSGGLDSTVLLHALAQHRPDLHAIHVNHGLSPAAADWQAHCQRVCDALGIPLKVCAVTITPGGEGPEAAARRARYREFEAVLEATDVLFQGHHLDDQVETFFLRLLRGAGLQGLSAMPEQRSLGAALLVRPLLSLSRDTLLQWAQQQHLQWVEDESNADVSLDRNFLRRELLPLLQTRWPAYRRTVDRAARHLRDAAEQLQAQHTLPTVASRWQDDGLPLTDLLHDEDLLCNAIRAWLLCRQKQCPPQAALREFCRQLCHGAEDGQPQLLLSDYCLRRYQGVLYVLAPTVAIDARWRARIDQHTALQLPGGGQLSLRACSGEGLRADLLQQLQVCWRRGGERCQPQGRSSSASLKKLLQQASVPPWWRDRLPLLYHGQTLVAVADLWVCEGAAATAGAAGYRIVWNRNSSGRMD